MPKTSSVGGYRPDSGIPQYLARKKSNSVGGPGWVSLVGATLGLFVTYFGAEAQLRHYAHPLHWAVAVGGGLAGGLAAGLIDSWRNRR